MISHIRLPVFHSASCHRVNFLKQWPPDDPLSVLEGSSPFTWPYYDGRFVDFYRKVRHHHHSFSRRLFWTPVASALNKLM